MRDPSMPRSTTTAYPTVRLQGGGDKGATWVKTAIRLPKGGTVIRTWNVRSLHACRKVLEVTHELQCYRWDILGLVRVRWTGLGETTMDEGHKIWYCREDLKHQYEVTFIIWKEVVGRIISCTSSPANSSPYPDISKTTQHHSHLALCTNLRPWIRWGWTVLWTAW